MSELMTEDERNRIWAALMEARYKPSRPLLEILEELEEEEQRSNQNTPREKTQ